MDDTTRNTNNLCATEEAHSRSVNDILANMRRTATASQANAAHAASAASGGGRLGLTSTGSSRQAMLSPISAVFPSPSVPPEIAHILLPGLPPTLAGGAPAVAAAHGAAGGVNGVAAGAAVAAAAAAGDGRHRPAGPAPPPSWLAQSRHAPRHTSWTAKDTSSARTLLPAALASLDLDMPGVSRPARGSLVDRALRRMALEWHVQKHYNQYYLMHLQGPLRAAIISYLGQLSDGGKGVSIGDLKALLIPPALPSDHGDGREQDGGVDDNRGGEELHVQDELPSPSTRNDDVRYLDLSGSVGRSLSIKELSDLLFPGAAVGSLAKTKGNNQWTGHASEQQQEDVGVLESWDLPGVFSPPRALLPNLTHLSLALDPERHGHGQASWRQLLAFASHLPMLTHLRLAYWPEPTLTPNAKHTTVVSPQGRRFQYGGTGFYSHLLDNDWAEAVLLVRKLSKALYGLEYLDLTGCVSWFPALMNRVDNDQVDWAGDWGKVTTLVLAHSYGHRGSAGDYQTCQADDAEDVAQRTQAADTAKEIEQHIRQQRAGQGRFITVEYDRDPGRKR